MQKAFARFLFIVGLLSLSVLPGLAQQYPYNYPAVQAAPGSGSFASPAPITVGTSATLLAAARTGAAGTGRIAITVTCSAAVAIGPTSGVTFAAAGQIPAGGALTLNTTSAVYGIVASGSTTCNLWETF